MALLTPAGCRTALATWLATVPGIAAGAGRVHERRRIIRNEAAIKSLLSNPAGKVNAWMISPAAGNTTVTTRNPGFKGIGQKGGGQVMSTFQWQIEGYYQIDDVLSSETVFNDLVFAVMLDLNSYGTLAIPGVVYQLPADVEQFGYIMLAGLALYHYCRIGVAFQGKIVE